MKDSGVSLSLDGAEFPVVIDPGWSSTASMAYPRTLTTATQLPISGKILVAGGHASSVTPWPCELYDPATATWQRTGSMEYARFGNTASLLLTGKVLVVGGHYLRNCELYDPTTGEWSGTDSLPVAIYQGHTATVLTSGKVLITGGFQDPYAEDYFGQCRLYDPVTERWMAPPDMSTGRAWHTATRLPSGDVLVAAGTDGFDDLALVATHVASCEIYNPLQNSWSSTGPLSVARTQHCAGLLDSGKVLVAGGWAGGITGVCELFDPTANVGMGAWSLAAPLARRRIHFAQVAFPSGQVLAAGGFNTHALISSELYDPALGWSDAGTMPTVKYYGVPVLLDHMTALVVGGIRDVDATRLCFRYIAPAATSLVVADPDRDGPLTIDVKHFDGDPFPPSGIPGELLTDDARARDVPTSVYFPTSPGRFPLIVLSHGAGGHRQSYIYIAKRLATHGYVVAVPEHVGSNYEKVKQIMDLFGISFVEASAVVGSDQTEWENRAKDVTFLIDAAVQWDAGDPNLRDRIDVNRVGVIGHSYGAYTADAAGGVLVTGHPNLADRRVDAIIPLSPQGYDPVSPGWFTGPDNFKTLAIPCMGMSGSEDDGVFGETPPEWRMQSFDAMNPVEKYHLWVVGADHMDFTHWVLGEPASRRQTNRVVGAMSLAFFNVMLKNDEASKSTYLQESYADSLTSPANAISGLDWYEK